MVVFSTQPLARNIDMEGERRTVNDEDSDRDYMDGQYRVVGDKR